MYSGLFRRDLDFVHRIARIYRVSTTPGCSILGMLAQGVLSLDNGLWSWV